MLISVQEARISKGWMGKLKGMLLVLWEHGFIDEANIQQYTINGRKDADGILIANTSMKRMVSNLHDFEEEDLLLQSMGCLMGVIIVQTHKCHCKFAGEGIEYSWGSSKNLNTGISH